jgi:hypothetical protein
MDHERQARAGGLQFGGCEPPLRCPGLRPLGGTPLLTRTACSDSRATPRRRLSASHTRQGLASAQRSRPRSGSETRCRRRRMDLALLADGAGIKTVEPVAPAEALERRRSRSVAPGHATIGHREAASVKRGCVRTHDGSTDVRYAGGHEPRGHAAAAADRGVAAGGRRPAGGGDAGGGAAATAAGGVGADAAVRSEVHSLWVARRGRRGRASWTPRRRCSWSASCGRSGSAR